MDETGFIGATCPDRLLFALPLTPNGTRGLHGCSCMSVVSFSELLIQALGGHKHNALFQNHLTTEKKQQSLSFSPSAERDGSLDPLSLLQALHTDK